MWLTKYFLWITCFSLSLSSADVREPVCDISYGKPIRTQCIRLLLEQANDPYFRFLGVPSVSVKPTGITDSAWMNRKTLPWMRGIVHCNIALLSILKPDGKYTWAQARFSEILHQEILSKRFTLPGGVLNDCVVEGRVGGWRRVCR